MNDLALDKKTLRSELRMRLQGLNDSLLRDASRAAAERLAQADEFRRAQAVMIFLPLVHEIDARPIALRAWQEGKIVTVPLVGHEHKHMIPVVVRSLEEPMDEDRYGVRAPQAGEPFPIDMLDLVLVPGLGFDRHGQRLGRGGGFYDRFLAQPSLHAVTCGLAMAMQVVDHIPTAPHDVALDMLVTDADLIRFEQSSMME